MEGNITPVLSILDERMKELYIGGGVTTNMEEYTPHYDIATLNKNWEG